MAAHFTGSLNEMASRLPSSQSTGTQLPQTSPADPAGCRLILVVDQGTALGGSVLVACALARHAQAFGIKVGIATAVDPDAVRGRLDPGGPVHHLTKRYSYEHHSARAHRWRGNRLWHRAALWASLPEQLWSELSYLFRLVALIRRERYQLVHLNNGMANTTAAWAALATRRPFVVHYHGYCEPSPMRRFLARRAAAFVAISDSVAASIPAIGARPDQIVTLLNPLTVSAAGSATSREETRRRWGVPTDAKVFGIVGRIVSWKGQLEFLEAARTILAGLPDAWGVIIGDAADGGDGYSDQVRQRALGPSMQGRVVLAGFMEDAAELYAGLDVMVHSSTDPEPFGLVISEAMAAGVPVVASPRGAPVELVEDEVTGFLRDPMDPAGVAEAVTKLLQREDVASNMAEVAQRRIRGLCDPRRFAEAMARLYHSILQGSAA